MATICNALYIELAASLLLGFRTFYFHSTVLHIYYCKTSFSGFPANLWMDRENVQPKKPSTDHEEASHKFQLNRFSCFGGKSTHTGKQTSYCYCFVSPQLHVHYDTLVSQSGVVNKQFIYSEHWLKNIQPEVLNCFKIWPGWAGASLVGLVQARPKL